MSAKKTKAEAQTAQKSKGRVLTATDNLFSKATRNGEFFERWEENVNGVLVKGRDFVYKRGEWTVRMVSSGVYVCTHGAHRLTLNLCKGVTYSGSFILGALQVAWESIESFFNSIFQNAKTAGEAATNFVREASGKMRAKLPKPAVKASEAPIEVSEEGNVVVIAA